MMKHYLLGICFLASIGTTCFDAYCMSIDRNVFKFNEEDLDDNQQKILDATSSNMIKDGYFGIVKQENVGIEIKDSQAFVDRVYTSLRRPIFVNGEMEIKDEKFPEQNQLFNYHVAEMSDTLTKNVLLACNNKQCTKSGSTYTLTLNDFKPYSTSNKGIRCSVKIRLDKQNISDIYIDFDGNIENNYDSFLQVKRKLLGIDGINSAKTFLKNIVINNDLLSRDKLIEHIVNHGHFGSVYKTSEINEKSPFVVETKDKKLKLNAGDLRYFYDAFPRGVFITGDTRIISKKLMFENCKDVLNKIKDKLTDINNFEIQSCTQGNGNSLEVIIKFNIPLNGVRVKYARDDRDDYAGDTICMYLNYNGYGWYDIASLFPVKNKEDLWDNEALDGEPGPGRYNYSKKKKDGTTKEAKDAKTAMRYLSYIVESNPTKGGVEYFKNVINTSNDIRDSVSKYKYLYRQFSDIRYMFNDNHVKSIDCTTCDSINDIDIEVTYTDDSTDFIRCKFVKEVKEKNTQTGAMELKTPAHLQIKKIYNYYKKEEVWESEQN